MIFVEILRLILIALLIVSDGPHRILISPYVIFLLGLAQPVFLTSFVSVLRRISDDSYLPYALGMIANIERITNIIGLTAGAFILSILTINQSLMVALIFIFVSSILICLSPSFLNLRLTHSKQFKFINLKGVRFLDLTIFLLNFGAGVINLFQIILALEIYMVGPRGLALMFLIVASLGFVGALFAGAAVNAFGVARTAVCAAIGVGFSLAGMAAPLGLIWSACAGGAMLGFGQVFAVAAHTMLVTQYPVEQSARGSARFQSLTYSGVAMNALAYFLLAPVLSFLNFVFLSAVFALVSAIILVFYLLCDSTRNAADTLKTKE